MDTKFIYRNLIAVATGILVSVAMTGCDEDPMESLYIDNNDYYEEAYRPLVHFTPQKYWMNDPNGMIYLDGEYHLFYQYNPQTAFWGNMSWGHAVSKDLMHWENLPVALTKDHLGDIFTGSAVIDTKNTAGFGENALVAIYTSSGEKQTQSIAYSLDKGRTFTKFAGNPVLANDGRVDFRDPKVFWYERGNCWIMSLATSQTISFYKSANLRVWEKLSEFGDGIGSHGGVWECPDLFAVNYEGKEKWVLLVSINPGGPNGGSATQYFVGDFDGTSFKADPLSYPLWVDYGKDNYAGVTWNNAPDNRHLFIGWMSNWQYAGTVPSMVWRGGATLPRELALKKHPDGYPVLTAEVVKEIEGIAGEWRTISSANGSYELGTDTPYQLEITMTMVEDAKCVLVMKNGEGEKLPFTLDRRDNRLTIDRSASGKTSFSGDFGIKVVSPMNLSGDKLTLMLYVDRSSIECLLNGGLVQQTNLVYPKEMYTILSMESSEGKVTVDAVKVRNLNRVW